jgi:hypothetical protein
MRTKNAGALFYVLAVWPLLGCDEPPPQPAPEPALSQQGRVEFAPEDQVGPSAPAENPTADTSEASQALIAFGPTGIPLDQNHMDSKPASGCSNGVASSADARLGMEYFQRFRKHLGLSCVSTPDYAQAAAGFHSIYMADHFSILGNDECALDGHREKRGCHWFSGESPSDQMVANGMPADDLFVTQVTGECLGCELKPTAFMAGMMAGPYHRRSMMRPWATMAGYSTFFQSHLQLDTWANALYTSGKKSEAGTIASSHPNIFYPIPGDSNVPLRFNGIETPQPPAPPTGWPSGYPVTIVANTNAVITGTAFCLVESNGTCTHVPHVALVNSVDARTEKNVGQLYGHRQLLPNRVYRVQFFGSFNGVAAAPWWEFRTRN